MDNKTRAEKIIYIVHEEYGSGCIDRIIAHLDEAVREAESKEFKIMAEHCDAIKRDSLRQGQRTWFEKGFKASEKESFNKGYATAREKAAGIAENNANDPLPCGGFKCIADRIRGMTND